METILSYSWIGTTALIVVILGLQTLRKRIEEIKELKKIKEQTKPIEPQTKIVKADIATPKLKSLLLQGNISLNSESVNGTILLTVTGDFQIVKAVPRQNPTVEEEHPLTKPDSI
jgi:hypothetical protein